MKIRLPQIIIVVFMVSLVTFLFIKTNIIKSEAHNRFSQNLRQLKEIDATLDKNIIESRYGLMTTYDLLITEISELNRLKTDLKNTPDFLQPDEREKINKLFEEFGELQNRKELLIERFNSRNAIINNSLRYFPVAASNLIKSVPPDSRRQKDLKPLNYLLRDILNYYLLTDTELEAGILSRIAFLEKQPNQAFADKTDLAAAVSHARTILTLKPEVDELVKQTVSLPTSAKIEEIMSLYDSYYDQSLHKADDYRLLLYIFSVFLLAYITFIIIKLKKATSTLNAVNESLEQRVQTRTEELLLTNAELKKSEANNAVIFEIIQGISKTAKLKELLEHIYFSVSKFLNAENYFIALFDGKTETLNVQYFIDKYDAAPPPIKLDKGLTAYVFRKSQPLLAASKEIRKLIQTGEIELSGTFPAVWLGILLRTPSGVIGVLVVQHYEDETAYSQRELEILTSVGDQIAIAIERKRSEEAVQNPRDYLDRIINAVGDPIFVKNRRHQWTLINDALCEFMEHSREELIGKSDYDFFNEAEAGVFWEKDELFFVSGKENINEERFTDSKGNLRIIVTRKRLHIDKEGEEYIVAVINDVTERKLLEEKIQRGQKMESIGQLAAGIAHEINTPTQYVGDNVRFLKDSFEEFNQVILNMIINAAHSIGDKIGDGDQKGIISISTQCKTGWAEIRISERYGQWNSC